MDEIIAAVSLSTVVVSVIALLVTITGIPLAKAGYRIIRSVLGFVK